MPVTTLQYRGATVKWAIQSMGLQRVGHEWVTKLTHTNTTTVEVGEVGMETKQS